MPSRTAYQLRIAALAAEETSRRGTGLLDSYQGRERRMTPFPLNALLYTTYLVHSPGCLTLERNEIDKYGLNEPNCHRIYNAEENRRAYQRRGTASSPRGVACPGV